MPRGTNEGNYLIEIEGIASVRAMDVRGGKLDHAPTKVTEGNRPNPRLVRGTYEIGEVTVKQASALNDAGREFFAWLYGVAKGTGPVERRTLRIVTLDETGHTPVETWEYVNCLPTSIQPDDRTARGQNAASFTFGIMPEDVLPLV